jgi:hypothetical protein
MRVAYDSRAKGDPRGIGRYVRCILEALQETAADGDTLTETHHPRGSQVFHSPWLDGAQLRCPCAAVVTIHDLVNLKGRTEYLRSGMRFRLRYLAVQRAERVIVPSEVVAADAQERLDIERERIEVIPEAAAAVMYPRGELEVAAVRSRYGLPATCCGSAACFTPSGASASSSWRRRPARCRSCSRARRASGRLSSPT